MPAILDRPHHLRPITFTDPHHCLGMPNGGGSDDFFTKRAPDFVDSDECMCALVHIGSNNNHGGCLLHCEVTVGPVGGQTSVGAVATLLSSHAGRSFTPGADKTHERQPESGTHPKSQTPGDQDPTTATCGDITLTLMAP